MSFTSNQAAYEKRNVVHHYAALSELQSPEKSILNSLRENLRSMKMLDIGVGAGRTTLHFAKLVSEYVAVDYSESMIKACEKRFGRTDRRLTFKVCDVRSMTMFPDEAFDFVLFSYNGIDSISHEDRLQALQEIRRVCRPSGFFCFSSHNLRSIAQLYVTQSDDPARMLYRKLIRNPLLTLLNEDFESLRTRNYAMLRDGTHHFRLKTYYIDPSEQLRQLTDTGFRNARAYLLNGEEIADFSSRNDGPSDHWIYYLCNA